jgi:ribosomal protein S18 acetylase RimI-like enzyme
MSISIRRAEARDAAALSTFAAAAFHDAFGAHNTPDNMARYVAESFSAERQAAEIADPAGEVVLAEDGGQLAGYVRIVRGGAPATVAEPAIEIRRLYVDRTRHGAGVAQLLMDATIDAARRADVGSIWLAVWERNARAIRFYEKSGFARVGSTRFLLGDDEQTDWLMARAV